MGADFMENNRSAAIAGGLTTSIPQALNEARALCVEMVEAQQMCEHVLERLEAISKEADEVVSPPQDMLNRYSRILYQFHAFLKKFGQDKPIMRLVCNRVVVRKTMEFHMDIDKLLNGMNIPRENAELLEWKSTWENLRESQVAAFQALSKNRVVLMSNLRDPQSQSEALTLLMFESKKLDAGYNEAELQVINMAFGNVARLSRSQVPRVPEWFLPPHEVEFESEPFAWGAYSKVYRGTLPGLQVVVKSVQIEGEHGRAAFMREAQTWFQVKHMHVVRLVGAFHVGLSPYFVCEYAENGTLRDYLFKEENRSSTWEKLYEASLGLQFLHAHKIIHNDLKCNTVLVGSDNKTKLSDFGLSSVVTTSQSSSAVEAVAAESWKAPEVLTGESSASFESDIYSFGMCIIEAVSLNYPWGDLPVASVRHNVSRGVLPDKPDKFSDEQWKLVTELCAFNPPDRLQVADVVLRLRAFAESERVAAAKTLDPHMRGARVKAFGDDGFDPTTIRSRSSGTHRTKCQLYTWVVFGR